MEHLRDDCNDCTFDEKLTLYCDPSYPVFDKERGKSLDDFVKLPGELGWDVSENGGREPKQGFKYLDFSVVAQRWLYFEVLAQVFGHLPRYTAEDFIHLDRSGRRHIDTRLLPEYIKDWLDYEKSNCAKEDLTERNRRLVRIQQVLDRARVYVSQYCTVQKLSGNATWEIDELLALNLLVLGETLTRAQSVVQRKVRFCINGWCSRDIRNHGWGYSTLILRKLKKHGWCAKAVQMLQASLRGNTIGLVYLYALRESSSKGPDHGGCTATECKFEKVNGGKEGQVGPVPYHHCEAPIEGIYRSPETPKRPSCTTCHIDGNKLASIIDKGHIPLFRFDGSRRDLQLVEMSQSFDKSYAIFSHVWTDGFGSLDGRNGMNHCVLNMFSKILKDIAFQREGASSFQQHTIQQGGANLALQDLFWIDTIAIPQEKEHKSQRLEAISQTHNIYTHATYTIVLDLGLMGVTTGSGYSSPAMKITMSRWMTRLWTLQEAVLSKNLFFCFKDRVYSMTQLEDMFAREDSELHLSLPSLSRTYYHGILGEMRLKIQEEFRKGEGWEPKSDFLAAVLKAAQWRSTTHAYHETLSLATMLNVDLKSFASPPKNPEGSEAYQQECDDRMIELLSLFGARSPCPFPPGMIFLPGPRLSKKGYGWAPRTWLSLRATESPDPLSLPHAGNTRLTPLEGLEVQFPGFVLHDLGDSRSTLISSKDFHFPANATLLEWYHVELAVDTELAEHTVHFPEERQFRGRDLAIVMPRLPVLDLKEISLFVAINKNYAGIRYVEILNRVWISNCKDRKGHSEALFAGEKLASHEKWCVDGSTQLEEPERIEESEELGSKRLFARSQTMSDLKPAVPRSLFSWRRS